MGRGTCNDSGVLRWTAPAPVPLLLPLTTTAAAAAHHPPRQAPDDRVLRHRGQHVHGEEEKVLDDNRRRGESGLSMVLVLALLFQRRRRRRRVRFLDPRPRDVHVEQHEERAEAEDRWVEAADAGTRRGR